MRVSITTSDDVLWIRWSRPEALNALDPEMLRSATDAIQMAGPSVRVVVITGDGRAFSSGAGVGEDLDERETINEGKRLVEAIISSELPVVAGLNGLAAGLGLSIALASDFVIARKSAYLLAAFVNIGLSQDGGLTALLSAALGRARATELLMLGERLSVEDAAKAGLIYRTSEDDVYDNELRSLVTRLAGGPTRAYAAVKRSVTFWTLSDIGRIFDAESESQMNLFGTEDAIEGTRAFREKRSPRFTGR